MIGRLTPAARQRARSAAAAATGAAPFDAFAAFDDTAGWVETTDVPTRPAHFYLRTNVLAAGAAMSVLLFVSLLGYALTRHISHRAAPQIPTDPPAASLPAASAPAPSAPVIPIAAPAAIVPQSSVPGLGASVGTPRATTPAKNTTVVTPSATAVATSPAAVAVPSGGRFTGVILSISGDIWTFTLWDGTTTSLRVTPDTQLTPKASLIPEPQFVDGQTVAVFWRAVGDTTLADHIYGIS